jgi:hypothetical protein
MAQKIEPEPKLASKETASGPSYPHDEEGA